jgi:hypothetical protein
MDQNSNKWFYNNLLELMRTIKASNERDEVIKALIYSKKYKLSNNLTSQLSNTIIENSFSIEKSLEFIIMPSETIWLEYNHSDRNNNDSTEIKTIGCLIMVNPKNESHISVWMAWQNKDDNIYNSYAIMHWNSDDFSNLNTPKKDDNKSGERLIDLVKVTIPKGFKEEFLIINELEDKDNFVKERAFEATQKSVSGEHFFLLASLLFMNSKNYLETKEENGTIISNLKTSLNNRFHLNLFRNTLIYN